MQSGLFGIEELRLKIEEWLVGPVALGQWWYDMMGSMLTEQTIHILAKRWREDMKASCSVT